MQRKLVILGEEVEKALAAVFDAALKNGGYAVHGLISKVEQAVVMEEKKEDDSSSK